MALLKDHLDVAQCQIIHNSSLQLFLSSNPNHNSNQVLHQSPAPSNLNQQIMRVMVSSNNNNESLPSYSLDELLGIQDLPPVTVGDMINRKKLVQAEIRKVQEFPVMVTSSRNIESSLASNSSGELLGIQDSPRVTVGDIRKRNKVVQHRKSSPLPVKSPNSSGELLGF